MYIVGKKDFQAPMNKQNTMTCCLCGRDPSINGGGLMKAKDMSNRGCWVCAFHCNNLLSSNEAALRVTVDEMNPYPSFPDGQSAQQGPTKSTTS